MAGIGISVASLILTISVMNGFEREMIDRTLSFAPHLEVYSSDKNLINDLSDNNIKSKYTYTQNQSIIKSGDNLKGVRVFGIENFDNFKTKVVSGSKKAIIDNSRRISLGIGLAKTLDADIGSKIELIFESKEQGTKTKVFKVGMIYEVGMHLYDENVAIINIKDAEKIWKDSGYVLGFKLIDPMDVKTIYHKFSSQLANSTTSCGTCLDDWENKNKNIINALKTERTVMGIILSILVLISVFNLVSSLMMTVKDKTTSISILKTMGATNNDIRKIFILQGTVIGLVGATIGGAIGILLSINIEDVVGLYESLAGSKIMDPDVYYISTITADINFTQVAMFYFSAVFISILSTIYPSHVASNIEIVQGLEK